MDNKIYDYIKNGITIKGDPVGGYQVFTIPTQHFKIDSLHQLTPEVFEEAIRKQKECDELTFEIFKEVQKEIDMEIVNQLKNMVKIVNELYSNYEQNWMKENPPFSAPNYEVCYTKEEFIDKLLFDDDFYQEWGQNCCEELTYEERYKIWFSNNYETGFEYNDDKTLHTINFDDPYWEPTPKRKLK